MSLKQKESGEIKICLSSTGETLDSQVDPRFGRCQYFLIVDKKTGKFKSIANEGVEISQGAGISAAQIVTNEGIKAIITGNIGPNASMVLNQAGIEIYTGVFDKTCKEALELLNDGKLKANQEPTGPGGHVGAGQGGFGSGGGGGQGRKK